MPAGTTGAATIRHVGLVALEALLVAILVWVATMALAGASQSDGFIGSATAGGPTRGPAVTVLPAGGAVVTAGSTEGGNWLHVTCPAGVALTGSHWIRIVPDRALKVRLGAAAPASATCVVEQGHFSANGKWRVIAATPFTVGG